MVEYGLARRTDRSGCRAGRSDRRDPAQFDVQQDRQLRRRHYRPDGLINATAAVRALSTARARRAARAPATLAHPMRSPASNRRADLVFSALLDRRKAEKALPLFTQGDGE